MDQKFKFGGTIGYGDSYMEFFFRQFKIFRVHAILHDTAGAVWAHSGKGAGYCYMIGQERNSCLLGHVTGLLFCLYVKLSLPSIFKSVDFWSIMSCIALDIGQAEKKAVQQLGLIFDGNVQGYSFRPPKSTDSQGKQFNVQETCRNMCGPKDLWPTERFPKFFLEM